MILYVIQLSILAGVLYRLGGKGKPWNTKIRDLGVPLCASFSMVLLGKFHWSLILCFGALFGALTTYNKWAGLLIGEKDKSKVTWVSWLVTGVLYGVSMLPFALFNNCIFSFAIRTVVLGLTICLWSSMIGKDWLEEWGRGFLIVISLLFFLL